MHSHVPYNNLSQIYKNILDTCLLVRVLPKLVTSPASSYTPSPTTDHCTPTSVALLPSSSLTLRPGPLHSLRLHTEQWPCRSPRRGFLSSLRSQSKCLLLRNSIPDPFSHRPPPTHLPAFVYPTILFCFLGDTYSYMKLSYVSLL